MRDAEQSRRPYSYFSSMDDRAQIGQRNEDTRIPDHIVIQEIARAGMEIVHLERPAAPWDREADIVLNIALACQRNKSITLCQRELQQRTGQAVERRRLIVVGVVAVQNPVEFRNPNGPAHPRIGRVLVHQPPVVREPQPEIQRQPRCHTILILREERG